MAGQSATKVIKRMFRLVGLEVQRSTPKPPLDLTNVDIDPLSACYLGGREPVLINFPLRDCVYENLMAFKCDAQSPYVRTLLEYREKICTSYSGSWLALLHREFQPKNAAELMGIDTPSYATLSEVPARGALLPWDNVAPQQRYVEKVEMVEVENRENGARLRYEDGDKFFGPCSKHKGELEYRRLVDTYESIASDGYDPYRSPGDNLSGIFLIKDDLTGGRMLIHNGQHRIAALETLKTESIAVQLNVRLAGGIVRRADVRCWPTVRAGYLNENEALALFDRIFAGEQPPVYNAAYARMTSQ